MSDPKNEKILTTRGVVTESLPSTLFRVKIPARNTFSTADAGGEDESDKEILAYLSGKMRMHRIKVLIGDSVEVVLDSYGGKGRIIKRL
ncbi:MAG: translation initiation factor IF-1 [Patescibacteria group bacterium]